MAHVVAVADVGEFQAAQVAEALFEREEIGERLARMKAVGKRVDDGDARVCGELVERFLREHARDDAVHPALEAFRDVGDRLALAKVVSVWSRKIEVPPRLAIPTSNVTRVRSEGFSKISAKKRPASAERCRSGRALISAAR